MHHLIAPCHALALPRDPGLAPRVSSLGPDSRDHEVNMPTDTKSHEIPPEILEEIAQRFRPIEHLFDVMGAADTGKQGVFVRRWAEIGIHLATILREHLDQIVATAGDDDCSPGRSSTSTEE